MGPGLAALARETDPIVIVGCGPAGLTAAYELAKAGVPSLLFEATAAIGGISQTAEYKGYLFDIGGHRFFSKSAAVNALWAEVLGDDFLVRPRLSRILYRGRFFNYPLEPVNALLGIGPVEALRCCASFARAQLFPTRPEKDLATWVSNRFGKRLFGIFFKGYTEKVWGIPCTELSAEWGAQRIKGLSLWSALVNAVRPRSGAQTIKTLIDQFHYPRRGPGMMWERVAQLVEQRGCRIVRNAPVTRLVTDGSRVAGVEAGGEYYRASHVISTMPLRHLVRSFDGPAPANVITAAANLHYRDFLTVALIVKKERLFPDNWIYIHDDRVKVGRIQNYKNWSPEMSPDPQTTCLGLEYFCFKGDDLWSMADPDLVALARAEVARLGLAAAEDVVDGTVVRMPKAYPVYDNSYQRGIGVIRDFLATIPNLHVAGRNGMHRYNNQDHSMLTGLLAARNVLGGHYDLWRVNADEDYHESDVVACRPDEFQVFESPAAEEELAAQ